MKEIAQNVIVDPTMDGGLFVKGETGLKVGFGDTQYGVLKVLETDTKTVLDPVEQNKDFAIRRKVGNDLLDALTLDSVQEDLDYLTVPPTVELDIQEAEKFQAI